MSTILILLRNVHLNAFHVEGDAKVLLAHPTSGSMLKRCLVERSNRARVPLDPTSTYGPDLTSHRFYGIQAEQSRESLAENLKSSPQGLTRGNISSSTARLKVVP
jgi:hypothetical protein